MEMKEKLMDLSEQSQSDKNKYFVLRYNEVIQVYNESVKTPQGYLEALDANPFFMRISNRLNKPMTQILMVLVLAVVPVLNLVCLGFLWFYYFHLYKQSKIHSKNLKKCSNPFDSFYFLPELCMQMGKHWSEMTIKTKDLEGFTFNKDLYSDLKQKHQSADSLQVIIYDQYFYDSFYLFKKEQYKVTMWIAVGTLLIAAHIFTIVLIFGSN